MHVRQRTSSLPDCHEAHVTSRMGEGAMTSKPHHYDETSPEHEHHPMIAAALITFPVMILASVVGSLFGMA